MAVSACGLGSPESAAFNCKLVRVSGHVSLRAAPLRAESTIGLVTPAAVTEPQIPGESALPLVGGLESNVKGPLSAKRFFQPLCKACPSVMACQNEQALNCWQPRYFFYR